MAVSNIKASFASDINKVWEIVTDVESCAWRSDLSRTAILNERQFVEYTKEGYATTFTVTFKEPYKRWEFDMENENIKGHWVGVFAKKGEHTEIDFTEDVTAKKSLIKPFLKTFLKKQQSVYVKDLRSALEKSEQ